MLATYALVLWTLFVQLTRVRNAASNDDALVAYVLPAAMIVLACLALAKPRRWTRLFALVSIAVWLVRVPMISAADHEVAFKVVHAGLGVVTIVLAVWALRREARRPAPA